MKNVSRWFLATMVLLIVVAILTHGPSSNVKAQKKGGGGVISPVFTVSPDTFHTAQNDSDALLCVHNGNAGAAANIEPGDVFRFTLDNTCGSQFVPNAAPLLVNSIVLIPADFVVGFGPDQITITYIGAAADFPGGDSFCAVVAFQTPAANEVCSVQSTPPGGNRYDNPDPDFNLISFVNSAPGIPADTMVFTDAAGCPAGFDQVAEFPGSFIRLIQPGDGPGTEGGAVEHTHGAGTYSAGDHTHTGTAGNATLPRFVDDNSGGTDFFVSDKDHVHTLTIDSVGGGDVEGISTTESNFPPFVMLGLCVKR